MSRCTAVGALEDYREHIARERKGECITALQYCSIGCRAYRGMSCPFEVKKALERVQLEIANSQDERLIANWLDWLTAHQMTVSEKCPEESPTKRLRSLVEGSQLSTEKCLIPLPLSFERH